MALRFALPALALLLLPTLAPAADSEDTYTIDASCVWRKTHLTVEIVPPALPPIVESRRTSIPPWPTDLILLPEEPSAPWENSYTRAAVDAVNAWERALHDYAAENPAAAHLGRLTFEARVIQPGVVPGEPDIRVIFSPTLAHIGGLAQSNCQPANNVFSCNPGEPCYALGSTIYMSTYSIYSYAPVDVYNIMLHELGHTLGLGHVAVPDTDLMHGIYKPGVGNPNTPKQCPSTLDLAQLATSYAWLKNEPYVRDPPSVSILVADYASPC